MRRFGTWDKEREAPFFLYLSFFSVHTPTSRAERIWSSALRGVAVEKPGAGYAAMVAAVDENVGRVMDELERLELSRPETLVSVHLRQRRPRRSHRLKRPCAAPRACSTRVACACHGSPAIRAP